MFANENYLSSKTIAILNKFLHTVERHEPLQSLQAPRSVMPRNEGKFHFPGLHFMRDFHINLPCKVRKKLWWRKLNSKSTLFAWYVNNSSIHKYKVINTG